MEKNYRRCLSCRRVAPKSEFLRIVRVHPSRTIELDQGRGRSAYICPCASCLKTAQHKNRLGRALKAKIPDAIYEQLWQRVESLDSFPSVTTKDSEITPSENGRRLSSRFARRDRWSKL